MSQNSCPVAVTNATESFENESLLRQYVVPGLMLLCVVSVVINVRILASVFWIRRPLSPTLHISLSLAVADTVASLYVGVGLAVNSLLENPLGVCGALVLEALRETSIIVTVTHLLALAANHYLGILRPLHYLSIMTPRITAVCIALLWVMPAIFFFAYFSLVSGQGFQDPCCQSSFLQLSKFRIIFSSMFFGPLLLMVFIYTHIFVIVRRHQQGRLRFSKLNHSYCNHQKHRQQQTQQMTRNVKAIYTTLLILGSYVVGLMPAVLVFILICNDCVFPFQTTAHGRRNMFFVYVFVNFLVILKSLLNPIIYAARMQEIKAATKRMCGSARHLLSRGSSDRYADTTCGTINSDVSQMRHLSSNGGSFVYRMRSFKSSVHSNRNNCQSVAL